jgi:S1-C subfamily serine protease
MRRIVALLAAALVAAGCGSSGGSDSSSGGDSGTQVQKTTTTRVEVVEGIEGGFDPRAIYEKEAPGIVTVYSVFGSGARILEDADEGGESGLGSGFVLNGEGEIATNAHVITTGEGSDMKQAREVYVQFGDGNRVRADIRGYDPNADIALLRIDPKGLDLNPLPLGSVEDIKVGEPVAALGSPFGEEQSLTVGVVSAVDRDIRSLTDFSISGAIQTDAAINPGNSGGPLVNAKGEVIGVNQQIKSASGGGEGVGFAVPIDMVKRSIEALREAGRVDYAYLGVSSQSIYPQAAERFDLPVERGALLQQINPGGPAARAGLKGGSEREVVFQAAPWRVGGDLVVKVGDSAIEDSNDLAVAVAKFRPGQKVPVEIYRDGKKRTVTVTLGKRPLEVAQPRG